MLGVALPFQAHDITELGHRLGLNLIKKFEITQLDNFSKIGTA